MDFPGYIRTGEFTLTRDNTTYVIQYGKPIEVNDSDSPHFLYNI